MGKHARTTRSRPASRPAHLEESTGWREQLAIVARAAVGTGAVVVLAVLAILAGAVLAVHGPGNDASAQSPSRQVTLGPPQKAKTPAVQPKHKTDNRPPKAHSGAARTAKPKTVVLVPGDTLYELAKEHHTTVKTLQRLNKLGTSTLIYAGDTLRLPGTVAGATEEPASAGSKTGPSAPKRHSDDTGKKIANTKTKTKAKGRAATAVAYARAQLGKPYIWGGTGLRGYDCSGLTMRAWQSAGVKLPRTTWSQKYAGKAITRGALVPGDLVLSNGDGHVALYIGGGKVIHAPKPGSTVHVAPLPPPAQTTGYRHIAS